MLSVIYKPFVLSVSMLNVIMLSVMAPDIDKAYDTFTNTNRQSNEGENNQTMPFHCQLNKLDRFILNQKIISRFEFEVKDSFNGTACI